jgi:hypothetical protein
VKLTPFDLIMRPPCGWLPRLPGSRTVIHESEQKQRSAGRDLHVVGPWRSLP